MPGGLRRTEASCGRLADGSLRSPGANKSKAWAIMDAETFEKLMLTRLDRIEQRLTDIIAAMPKLTLQVEENRMAVFGNGNDGLQIEVDRLKQQAKEREDRNTHRALWLGGFGAAVGALLIKVVEWLASAP